MDFLLNRDEPGRTTILLAHGSGAPMDTPWMNTVAESLADEGFRVARFEFSYMAAKPFLNKATELVRLHRPVTVVNDKAPTYRRVIREINQRYDPHFDSIRQIDRKWRNNLIESDHASLKRLLGYRQSFRSLRSAAKATLSGIEKTRTIKRGHIHNKQPSVLAEMNFSKQLFDAV